MQIVRAVPTNIITGFLGVGKSTAITYLLKHKPADEVWAVLVNEFGEIGVDGNLLGAGQEPGKVFIKEVPGGCMCCASGLPMQIALNMLLARSKPDRLLIEPTGLGHPAEVLASLSSEHYRGVLDIQHTLTLVDARKVTDSRYAQHDIFRQQLQVADVIVANKVDLYESDSIARLQDYLRDLSIASPLQITTQGQIPFAWLLGRSGFQASLFSPPQPSSTETFTELQTPVSGFISRRGQADGMHSCGWVFAPSYCFHYERLMSLMMGLQMERLKAIMHTNRGWMLFNQVDGVLTSSELNDAPDSRIECISSQPEDWSQLEMALQSLSC
ncbi:GTP-binding protein [Bowmanella sp. Y26]|uniref:CobW family GTP-binding protein n=1 Tax=Bowmanella yangjiangensis TaxID=2811230 RepID=UPI001BDD9CE8|nr:GTP-binding protein [Bowmanella yangjiangensis]MBT1065385.1 GTP-binding protein [Bowmanella yangjiangensis]